MNITANISFYLTHIRLHVDAGHQKVMIETGKRSAICRGRDEGLIILVCRWACKRATWERNTTIRLWIGRSVSGEDTKEDGGEVPESENENAKGLGEVKSSRIYAIFMVEVRPTDPETDRVLSLTHAQTDVGWQTLADMAYIIGANRPGSGKIPGFNRQTLGSGPLTSRF